MWIAKDVSEPARGWAGVTPNSIGTLLSVNGDEVVVKFPECDQWQGLLTEIEHVRPIIVGDKVKVSLLKYCLSFKNRYNYYLIS